MYRENYGYALSLLNKSDVCGFHVIAVQTTRNNGKVRKFEDWALEKQES